MTDTSNSTEKPTRETKAKYDWLDAAGNVVEDIESATGLKYTALGDNSVCAVQLPGAVAGDKLTMLALAGWKIEARNAARGVSATPAQERWDAIETGNWGVGGEGSRGPRGIDIEVLIAAATPLVPAANLEKVIERLRTDVGYQKTIRNHPDIKAAYDAAYAVAHPPKAQAKPLAELFA